MQAKVAEATVVIADASDAPTDAGGVVNKVPQTPTHVASLIDRRRSIIIAWLNYSIVLLVFTVSSL